MVILSIQMRQSIRPSSSLMPKPLSPASIRNTLSELHERGLIAFLEQPGAATALAA